MAIWQLGHKALKRLKIAIWTIAVLGFLYILPSLLLYIPSVQSWLGKETSTLLSDALSMPVHIDRVDAEGWSRLDLKGLVIKDSLDREAIATKNLRVGLDLRKIVFGNEIYVNSLRLFDLRLLLDIDSVSGKTNIEPIIKLIQGDPNKPSTLVVDLNNVLLRNARIDYLSSRKPVERLDSLDLKLRQLKVTPDSLGAELDQLSFRTQKGFRLIDLSSKLKLKNSLLSLSDIEAKLPNSYLHIPSLLLDTKSKGVGILRHADIKGINLNLSDLAPAYAPLAGAKGEVIRLSTLISRKDNILSIKGIEASMDNNFYTESELRLQLDNSGAMISADADIKRLMVNAKLGHRLAEYIPSLKSETTLLEKIGALGEIHYSGLANFAPGRDAALEGLLSTDLGKLRMNAEAELYQKELRAIKAKVSTPLFNLRPLLGNAFGLLRGDVEGDLKFVAGQSLPKGSTKLQIDQIEYSGKSYSDLRASLIGPEQGRYTLDVESKDKTLPLNVDGTFALVGKDIRNIALRFNATQLALKDFVRGIDNLSIEGEMQSTSLDINQMQANLLLPTLRMQIEGKPIDLSNISIDLSSTREARIVRLVSPWATARLEGKYKPDELIDDITATVLRQVPILSSLARGGKGRGASRALFEAEVDSVPSAVRELLKLPLQLPHRATITAFVDSSRDSLALNLRSPEAFVGQHRIQHLNLQLLDKRLSMQGNAYLYNGTQLEGFRLMLSAQGNDLSLHANLGQDSLGTKHGMLNVRSSLSSSKPIQSLKDLTAQINIDPSRLRIHSSFWDIAPANVLYSAGLLRVEGLQLQTEGRKLSIHGGIGNWVNDKGITVLLENINLRYILEAAGVYFDMLDTDLTGTITANLDADNHLSAFAKVRSPQFFVNKQDVGGIDIGLDFNTKDLLIKLNGIVHQQHGGQSLVDGWIKPANGAGIDLDFKADSLDVSFVGSFMDGFLSRLGGYATGHARLHGIFEEGVTVSADADIQEGRVGVTALGTEYRFNHRMQIEDTRINLEGIRMYDDEGNSGLLHGYIGHRFFDDFDIQVRADGINRLKVLQTTSPKLMPAYGKAYASGEARMTGSDSRLLIDVNLRSEVGTDVMLDFNTITAGRDEGLMRFVNMRSAGDSLATDSVATKPFEASSAIDLKLRLGITPEAKLAMRLGEDNSSILKGSAEGLLQITAPSVGNPEVYGTLSVKSGEYLFNLQQLAMKRFILREGGSLAFRGDAMRAELNNLKAVYALTANIADLDESISQIAARTNIPVHCLLTLSGEVGRPKVRFGLELPNADSEIERRVRALLNTEDAVTRQMLYLIALGKFYTDDNQTRTTSTTDNWTAVASSAISEQLSSILGSLSETIKLGTSIKTKSTAFDDTDIELNFSGSWLDNRLTINGNIGYHDNPYLHNQYLGEFDFEYRLNRSGTLRLKGYNRYNSMYQYLRQSLLTQGFGILYRQRFDSLRDLLRPSRMLKVEPVDSLPTDTIKIDSIKH